MGERLKHCEKVWGEKKIEEGQNKEKIRGKRMKDRGEKDEDREGGEQKKVDIEIYAGEHMNQKITQGENKRASRKERYKWGKGEIRSVICEDRKKKGGA